MTFSLLGRCARTGQFGAAVTTSSIAVGTRVPFLAPGIGGVLTQHRTDPRLGPRGLDLLRSGCSAENALAAIVASTPDHRWRQVAVMDGQGRTAHFDGERVKPCRSVFHGTDVVAMGNILANEDVAPAMGRAFLADPDLPLAERLVRALEAGEAAGGEHGDVMCASLLVVDREVFPYVDLRIDHADGPIPKLRALWETYAPLADGFVQRAIDPEDAPII
ncbi:DUF1028 domain-containing protein [Roseomonas sp. HJA6]|uniref:DUF1028 domain-containing protein n=1 Tax=Roseomonas alba TaxID=2846776 RepID=A0ABS7A5T6_9PROT|nr:DUF1028 domain-containing protein [Neoroseomonas alba]MBW6397677.1 DUF1028 domain-containing protein [Neoroseomonas alba]